MSEEDKKVEETTTPEQEEQTTEDTTSEEDASKQTTEQPEEEVQEESEDYKALYEQELDARKKAEHKIVKMRAKELENDEETKEEEPQEDLKSYVDKRLNEVKVLSLEAQYDAEIDRLATNDDEKKLIRLHLENNNFSGNVAEQVQKAKALANYKRVAQANKELAHSKSVQPGGEETSTYKSNKKDQQKVLAGLSDADISFLKKRGLLDKYVEKYG